MMTRRERHAGLIESVLRGSVAVPTLGVEVGVWWGNLSRHLLASFPDLHLVMVDPYVTYAGSKVGRKQEPLTAAKAGAEVVTREFADRRMLLYMSSVEAAVTFVDKSLSFVFIDGDHSYDAVLADLRAWEPKVKEDGLLFGHDYKTGRGFGVIDALNKFTKKSRYRVNVADARVEGVWFLERV